MADEQTGTYQDELPAEYRTPPPPKPQAAAPGTWEPTGTYLDELPDDLKPQLPPSSDSEKRKLTMARAMASHNPDETMLQKAGRMSLPWASVISRGIGTVDYGESKKQVEAGRGEMADYKAVANYEEQQRRDAERNKSLGGKLETAFYSLPAIAGEFATGSAVLRGAGLIGQGAVAVPKLLSMANLANIGRGAATGVAHLPLVPSAYVDHWMQGNIKNGRDPMDLRGLPPAVASGALQLAVLGGVFRAAGQVSGTGLGAYAKSIGYGASVGTVGSNIAHAAEAVVDQVLPKAYQMDTGYGPLGDMARGQWGEAGQHLFVQMATFAAFSALHGPHAAEPPKPQASPGQQLPGPSQGLPGPQPGLKGGPIPGPQAPPPGAGPAPGAAPEAIPQPIFEAAADYMNQAARSGMTKEAAMQDLGTLVERYTDAMKKNPNMTRDEARDLFSHMSGKRQAFGHAMVDAMHPEGAEPVPEAPPESPEPPKQAPKARPEPQDAEWFPKEPEAAARPQIGARPTKGPTLEFSKVEGPPVKGSIHEVASKAFPEAKVSPSDPNRTIARVGDATVYLEHDPGRNTVRIDFERPTTGVAKEVQPNSKDLLRGLKNLVSGLKDKGVGIEYRAIDTNRAGYRTGRADIYAKWLTKAGYEQTPESGKGGMYSWRPKATEPTLENSKVPAEHVVQHLPPHGPEPGIDKATETQPAPGGRAEEAGNVVEASRKALEEYGFARDDVLQFEKEAERLAPGEKWSYRLDNFLDNFERGTDESNPEIKDERQMVRDHLQKVIAAKGAGETPPAPRKMTPAEARAEADRLLAEAEPKGQPLSEDQARSIQESGLNQKQVRAIKSLMENGSFRKAGKQVGMSHEWVRTHANAALEKLKEADPDTWEGVEITKEGFQRAKAARAAAAVQPTGLSGESAETIRAAEKYLQEEREALDSQIDNAGTVEELADGFEQSNPALVRYLERQAQLLGLTPEGLLNQLSNPQRQHTFYEDYANERAAAKRAAQQPPALRREAPGPLQQGNQGAPVANAPPGIRIPTAAHGETQPAPGGRAEEAGNELTPPIPGSAEAVVKGTPPEDMVFHSGIPISGEALKHVWDNIREISGQMGPRMTAVDRDSGEALARYNASPGYTSMLAPQMARKTIPDGLSPAKEKYLGDVLQEWRQRYIKKAYTDAANARFADSQAAAAAGRPDHQQALLDEAVALKKVANNVTTLIGHPNHPDLPDFAAYRAGVTSPEFQQLKANWVKPGGMLEFMENQYRRAQGLEDSDPINSFTQIPGFPMHSKAMGKGGGAPTSRQGNLTNTELRKYPWANQARGDAEDYDTDLRSMIEHSIARGELSATKAELFRTMEANGVGSWGPRGAGGLGHMVPNVFPPKGTQTAGAGESAFYVADQGAFDELMRALKTDQPDRFPILKAVGDAFTRINLASFGEACSHAINLGTALFHPGMPINPFRYINYISKILSGDEATLDRLVGLARIGAMKTSGGMESTGRHGVLWGGPWDPTSKASQALDVMQKVMRLAADDAFEYLKKRGRAVDTETNRRDFINQLLGQYNTDAQQWLVAFLRNTKISPFATATSNFTAAGIRAATGTPAVEAPTKAAEAQNRAAFMLRAVIAGLGSAALINFLRSGKVRPEDTQLGDVVVGEKDGKKQVYNLLDLTGARRGFRAIGGQAVSQGLLEGKTRGEIEDRIRHDLTHVGLQLVEGPVIHFGHTALTGENALGIKISKQLTIREKRGGQSQFMEDLKAAGLNMNPIVAVGLGADRPDKPLTADRWLRLFGKFAPQERGRVPKQKIKK